jgi:hypothetical protein
MVPKLIYAVIPVVLGAPKYLVVLPEQIKFLNCTQYIGIYHYPFCNTRKVKEAVEASLERVGPHSSIDVVCKSLQLRSQFLYAAVKQQTLALPTARPKDYILTARF